MSQLLGACRKQFWQPKQRLTETAAALLSNAEQAMLKSVRTPLQRSIVDVNGIKVHTITAKGPSSAGVPVVLTHGYAAGSGFWYRNIDALAGQRPVYLIDWPGHGLSSEFSRSCFKDVRDAEDFFCDHLHEWSNAVGLSNFHLVGHSLGGYLAATYALKYPKKLESLIMTSPAGMPREDPNFWNEFSDRRAKNSMLGRAAISLVRGLWKAGMSPQMIMRALGEERGSNLMGRYAGARFTSIPEEEREIIGEYLYQLSSTRTSIEAAMPVLLSPGAWAKNPLCDRLHALTVPVQFLYGQYDWMPIGAAVDVAPKIKSRTEVLMIAQSGHFLFMENPWQYNSAVMEWMSTGYRGAKDQPELSPGSAKVA